MFQKINRIIESKENNLRSMKVEEISPEMALFVSFTVVRILFLLICKIFIKDTN